jgi:Domain of unknown function (DUF4157)
MNNGVNHMSRADPKKIQALPTPVSPRYLQRKCSCGTHTPMGGECAECAKKKIQKKLRIGAVNDPLEHEADRVADQVMRSPKQGNAPVHLQRISASSGAITTDVPASVHRTLTGTGRPLDRALRDDMSHRFGHDFSHVRVHQDAGAQQSAGDVNARAYTVGNNIVFGAGEYAPSTESGRRLVAHELAHVVQQGSDGKSLQRSELFSSTINICHRLLKSRQFKVTDGTLEVAIDARWEGPSEGAASCKGYDVGGFEVTLSKLNTVLDDGYGSCNFEAGSLNGRKWSGLPTGDYYLTIWTNNTNPYCCLDGTIDVRQTTKSSKESCTEVPDTTLEMLHTTLDLAGLVPALGAIPDALNAGIYSIEGDWVSAGISAAAIVPIVGEGATLTKLGLKISRKALGRVGKEGLEAGLKAAKQERKIAAELAENAFEKEAGKGAKQKGAKWSKGKGNRKFEPPIRDHGAGDLKLGGEIPKTGKERIEAISSWSKDELELTKHEIELSIAARKREQIRLGETTVGDLGQPVGAQHRLRIAAEEALLLAIIKKLSGK